MIRQIVKAGHELASHGYGHELITGQSVNTFREDVRLAKQTLEDISGQTVFGYRAPTFSITKETQWALAVLVEEGYSYDSSIVPIVHDFYGIPGAKPTIHTIETASGPLIEVPPSTCRLAGCQIPIAGGGYFRLFPYYVLKKLLLRVEAIGQPLIMYLHPWELDPGQPRMRGSFLSEFRHYLNLDKVQGRLTQLLQDFSFGPIQDLIAHPVKVTPSLVPIVA